MDFAPSAEQAAIVLAVERLLASAAGPERAARLAREQEWDPALERALADAGFLDTALAVGPLEAALVVEAVARAAGAVAIGAGALVAPLVAGRALAGPVAIALAEGREPVRFGVCARTLLLRDGDAARVVALEPGDFAAVRSGFGHPQGRLARGLGARGERLGPGSGERLLAWWRIALAAEALGAMQAALDATVAHVKQRRQFGRAIGSL